MWTDEIRGGSAARLERRMDSVLAELRSSIGDLRSAALVTNDGLTIAAWSADDELEEQINAVAASTLALIDQSSAFGHLGRPTQVLVRGSDSYFVTLPVGSEALLTVRTGLRARPGLILLKMKQAARRIELFL